MKITNKLTLSALALCAAFATVSCGDKSEVSSANTEATAPASENSFIVTTAPAGAISISEARKTIEIGKEITLNGKVMGRMDPFVEGRAMVVVGDPAIITSCDLKPDDHCSTPWDVCCDTPEDITASTATIQVLDADGKLLKQGLKGIDGMKELSDLVITGTIAEGSNADNLLISATSIYVVK